MADEKKTEAWTGYAILELMGHRRLGGFLSEQVIAGATMLRIDVPAACGEGVAATQFYSPAAIYAITPCGEAEARAVAARSQPQPVQRWEMPEASVPSLPRRRDDDDDLDDEEDDDDRDPPW